MWISFLLPIKINCFELYRWLQRGLEMIVQNSGWSCRHDEHGNMLQPPTPLQSYLRQRCSSASLASLRSHLEAFTDLSLIQQFSRKSQCRVGTNLTRANFC